jgi:membrane protein required for colicin V production
MSWEKYLIDIAAIALLALIFYKGFKKGLINKAVWLGSFVVAYLLASMFSYDLAKLLNFKIHNENITIAVSFAVISGVTILGMYFIGKWLTKLINLSVVGMVNRILGGVLNALIYVILFIVALNLALILVPGVNKYLEQTLVVGQVAKATEKLADHRMIDKLRENIDKLGDLKDYIPDKK